MFLWDVSTGRTIRKFRGHDGVVNSVSSFSIAASSSLFATNSGVKILDAFDVAVRVRLSSWMQLCLGPNEETMVTGGYDQAVRVWDMRSRSYDAIQTMKPFADSVTTVAVTSK